MTRWHRTMFVLCRASIVASCTTKSTAATRVLLASRWGGQVQMQNSKFKFKIQIPEHLAAPSPAWAEKTASQPASHPAIQPASPQDSQPARQPDSQPAGQPASLPASHATKALAQTSRRHTQPNVGPVPRRPGGLRAAFRI